MCWALVAAVLTPQLSLLSCTWWQVAGVIVGQSGGSAGLRPQAIGQSKASLSFRGSCAESLCPVFVVFLNYFWLCWISVALWYFSSCSKQGALLSSCGPLASRGGFSCGGAQVLGHVSSAVAAPGLQSTGSVVMAHRLSCPAACGIFPDQGSSTCLLHWQADSLPLSYQGNHVSSFNLLFDECT